jgi:hypothetical protein
MIQPPGYAQALIEMLAPPARRESIVGDLLEEYRESQLPRHGASDANLWYVRQALAFVWGAAAPWAIVFGLTLGLREVLDAIVPTADNFHVRAAVSTYLAFILYATAGLSAGWRSRRIASGFVVSLVMTTVATVITVGVVLAVGVLRAAGALQVTAAYSVAGGLDIPVPFMLIIGGTFATVGAAIGKAGRHFPRVDAA